MIASRRLCFPARIFAVKQRRDDRNIDDRKIGKRFIGIYPVINFPVSAFRCHGDVFLTEGNEANEVCVLLGFLLCTPAKPLIRSEVCEMVCTAISQRRFCEDF